MATIALLTDFGTADWFVACMKGTIVGINPRAGIVDITHDIPPGSIAATAFVLKACYRCFPEGTIFVAVVDPGVGSQRKALLARAGGYFFIGPDNGLFSYVLQSHSDTVVYSLDKTQYFAPVVSATFHGRDIFAPVSAHLSKGLDPGQLGSPVREFVRMDWPAPEVVGKSIFGKIMYIDRYGNAISNIDRGSLGRLDRMPATAVFKSSQNAPLSTHYQQTGGDQPLALFNSLELLEIAINGGNAAKALGIAVGDPIELR